MQGLGLGRLPPCQSVSPSQFKWRDLPEKDGKPERWRRGEGEGSGLGTQSAPTRWLSFAGQKFHHASLSRCWVLCLWNFWELRFHLFRRLT